MGENAAQAAGAVSHLASGNIALAVGIAVGLAALGVGIGQGLASSSGLSGMSRQPEIQGKMQTSMLIALAFIELVFLLTFVTAILLWTKI